MQPHPDFEGNVLCFGISSLLLALSLSLLLRSQAWAVIMMMTMMMMGMIIGARLWYIKGCSAEFRAQPWSPLLSVLAVDVL